MPEGPDKLSIIVFDGAFDRVHYALVLASAAAATNRAATLFFSGRAIHALTPQGWQRLDGDPIGQNHRLEASGVTLDRGYTEVASMGIAIAFLTDLDLDLKSDGEWRRLAGDGYRDRRRGRCR